MRMWRDDDDDEEEDDADADETADEVLQGTKTKLEGLSTCVT